MTRFGELILPTLFGDARQSERPVLVTLGGQPGAGKTAAAGRAQTIYPSERLTAIIGDDLRAYHPDYRTVSRLAPTQMPRVTARAAAVWTSMAVDHARRHRISVLLEGTFRDADLVTNTARTFAEAGFHVHAIALAVPPAQSFLSTVDRFYAARAAGLSARFTPPGAHDAAIAGMATTTARLGESADVARLTLLTRDGQVLLDHTAPSPGRGRAAREALTREHSRDLTADELHTWQRLYEQVQAVREDHDSELATTSETTEAWSTLTRYAATLRDQAARPLAQDRGARARHARGAEHGPTPNGRGRPSGPRTDPSVGPEFG